jgi:hypothetical protein
MIKIVSKACNEKAHNSTDIPDISYPIVLHKAKATPLNRKYQPELGEYKLELEFHLPDDIINDFHLSHHCQFQLGKFLNYETYLEIDGKEYRYSDIYSHETEMKAIISDAVARQLIEEITDD